MQLEQKQRHFHCSTYSALHKLKCVSCPFQQGKYGMTEHSLFSSSYSSAFSGQYKVWISKGRPHQRPPGERFGLVFLVPGTIAVKSTFLSLMSLCVSTCSLFYVLLISLVSILNLLVIIKCPLCLQIKGVMNSC